jgi:hypothetical protein
MHLPINFKSPNNISKWQMGFNSAFKGLIYVNNQQDGTVEDNLLFLDCSTCFERYFRSSTGASKLYLQFWYYSRMSLPAGVVEELEPFQARPRKYSLNAPDDERKYRSKHVE